MKKLVMTAAVLTCAASIVSAQTVTSANIVGYQKQARPSLQMVGSAWKTGSLDSILGHGHLAGPSVDLADKAYIYTAGSGYEQFYLYATEFNGAAVEWRSAATGLADGEIMNGTAIWLESSGFVSGDIINAGEVELGEFATNSIPAGLDMLSYPFSVEVADINSLTLLTSGFSFSVGFPANPDLSDKLYIYTPGVGYTTYFIHDNAPFGKEWRDAADPDSPLEDAVSLPLGSGFFYEAVSPFDWIETNPYFGL